MARVPDDLLERLKREVKLAELVVASGVKLAKKGQDLVGCCPFHADDTPSLVVSPKVNLWHCLGACQEGGSVVDWVMKSRGVSFRHAVELLREGHPSLAAEPPAERSPTPCSVATRPLAAGAFERDADDEALMHQVVGYYHEALMNEPDALGYLERRGLGDREMIAHFRIGFAGRTLGYRLPPRSHAKGKVLRERLIKLGVYRDSGHEHLAGSIVVPVFDETGRVVELYGRKIRQNLRKGTPKHLYLPGPHRGVFNLSGIKAAASEVILCESLFDALAFWAAGFREATASYGTAGFTGEHRAAFEACNIERVYIAYDADEAGERAAAKLAPALEEMGIEAFRIQFPKGVDACEYALRQAPAAQSLRQLVQQAVWMKTGQRASSPKPSRNEQAAEREELSSPKPPAAREPAGRAAKPSAVESAVSPSAADAAGPAAAQSAQAHELLGQVVGSYHASLKESPEALAYLRSRGLGSAEMIERFRVGYANNTLSERLADKASAEGAAVRRRLEELGLLRDSGHERFNGSVVVPLLDADGHIVQLYGRRLRSNLGEHTRLHLYLPGPRRGLFNRAAFEASREIIMCEAIIDALTFWCAGLRHVSTCYGVDGFTGELRDALSGHGIERVYLAFDRDKAGDEGAKQLAAELARMGIEAFRIVFPRAMDANEYAQKVTPAEQSLRAALRGAEWMAGKRRTPVNARTSERAAEPAVPAPSSPEAAAAPASLPLAASAAPPATSRASSPEGRASYDAQADEVRLIAGERLWRVRGLSKNSAPGALRVNVLVSREGVGFHVDTLELYSARQRYLFVKMAASELGSEEEQLKKEIATVLLELERLQHELLEGRAAAKPAAPELSDNERQLALALLRDPKLIERVLSDFERLGVVGERTNKLVAFLSATSRKLDQPLAVVIQSSSAAGKSSLMEAVLSLMPDEERVQYSAMTGQSLFYMGEADLQHKILAIAEEEGAERASYALKLLQSEGQLTIASTGKDPHTGRLVTQEYRVEGPVMIMLTTTAIDVDEELLNRCIVLSVDEGREQTRAIHERQRRAQTLAGVLEREERSAIIKLHQNAQRLLRPLTVVNPFAERLHFVDHQTRSRRDHMKYLTLIRAIALLHQHQRELKDVSHQGRVVRYIEVTERDIALADRLAERVLVRSTDELPPQTRRLLGELAAMVAERVRADGVKAADVRFTRRDVREHTGWSQSQLKTHMRRLEELEYLLVHAGGARRRMIYELNYEPNWSGQKPTGLGLVWAQDRPDSPSHSERASDLVRPREGHCSTAPKAPPVVVDGEPAPAAE